MPILYDSYGRPVDLGALKKNQAFPTLAGVRGAYSNLYPSVGLTPERLSGILRQADFGDPYLFLELAEEIEEKDTHYGAVLNKRKGAVSSLELLVQPASKSPEDEDVARFIRDVLVNESSINLSDRIYDILDALGKGFSATEIEWDTKTRINGKLRWLPKQLHPRDPRWFMFDWISGRQILVRTLRSDGQTVSIVGDAAKRLGMVDKNDGGQHLQNWNWNDEAEKIGIQPLTEPLRSYKFITHFGRAKSGLPTRAGLTRCIAYIYLFKNYTMKDWLAFNSRYGLPLRLGVYDGGANDQDKQALLNAVSSLGTDMGAIIPKTMELKFEQVGNIGAATDLYRTSLEYLDDLESKLVLGSTLGTQVRSGSGSRAAAETHRDVERDIMESDVKRLEGTLNRDLVRPLVDLNVGPPKNGVYPRLRIGLPDNDDISSWVKNVTALAQSGMPIGVGTIYEKMHLTPPEANERILTPPEKITVRDDTKAPPSGAPTGADDGPTGDDGDKPAEPEEAPPETKETRKVQVGAREDPHGVADELAERAMSRWEPVMQPMVEPVMKAIRAAKSYDDLTRRLKKLAPEMDATGFQELMSQALFAALMVGKTGLTL